MATIQERNLATFFPPNSPLLDRIAQVAPQKVDQLCQRWRVAREIGQDVVKLGLYDIILYIGMLLVLPFWFSGLERLEFLSLLCYASVSTNADSF